MSPEFTTDLRPLLNKLITELDRLSEELKDNEMLYENKEEQLQTLHVERDGKV